MDLSWLNKLIRLAAGVMPDAHAWLVLAAILGGGFSAVATLFKPVLAGRYGAWIDLDGMTTVYWFFFAAILIGPVYWVVLYLDRRLTPVGKRRRFIGFYVDVLADSASRLNLPKAAENRVKEKFLNRLADSLASGRFEFDLSVIEPSESSALRKLAEQILGKEGPH